MNEAALLKVYGMFQITQAGEWKQSIEIIHDGVVIGYVDRYRTRSGKFVKTRTLRGDILEGECLEWLLRQPA